MKIEYNFPQTSLKLYTFKPRNISFSTSIFTFQQGKITNPRVYLHLQSAIILPETVINKRQSI